MQIKGWILISFEIQEVMIFQFEKHQNISL